MSAPTTLENLAAALAQVQARLPEVRKSETAQVQTKTGGSYRYSYADLAAISRTVLPLLGENGLAWTCRPTLVEGRFALIYSLLHISGERVDGEYPLPAGGSPQEIGSAITYARRYALCAVTGVVPDDDDDGAAATRAHRDAPGTGTRGQPDDPWESATPAASRATAAQQRPSRDVVINRAHEAITAASTTVTLDQIADLVDKRTFAEIITADDATSLHIAISNRRRELAGETVAIEAVPMADRQRRELFALFAEVGIADRDAQLALLAEATGRERESRGDLTAAEADTAIAALRRRRANGRHNGSAVAS